MLFITILLSVFGIAALVAATVLANKEYPTPEETKLVKPTAIAGAVLLVLAYLTTAIVTVGVGQIGVVTRFGAVTGREVNPGVAFKAPAPFESVVVFDTRVQKDEVEATAASRDLQDVKSKLAINYHLERGKVSAIYQSVGTDFTTKILAPAIQESFKATTAQFSAEDLIKQRAKVSQSSEASLAERLKQYGIVIDSISILDLTFSQQFTAAIEAAQVAQQQAVKATNDLERVKKEADQKVAQAQAEAEAQRLQAQSITPEYLELQRINVQSDWIKKWSGNLPTTMTGDNTLFSLPIGK